MRLSTAALLLLLVSSLSPGHGILETHYTNRKCRCSKGISTLIHPSIVERVQVKPPGNGCPQEEIIIWTKKMFPLCLNPKAKWILNVIKLSQSKSLSSTPQAPVSKKRTS
ncbi:C-X-C motif chemokine 13 [Nannospalax galili]|uniref:C-X-C motif chemokine n=1 Tax=Nannospalax galili TaxID=1026970 RepID=A0A8C6W898_NANGA|nr:C-X-C motif chemokine 13 [Nannospalax galili]